MDEIILNTFENMFPDAFCELNHRNHFELLVAVILSAQTTDVSVNKITKTLFEMYKTPSDFVQADIFDIEHAIKSIGLFKNKAKNIQKLCKILVMEFNSNVPNTMEELIKLPGVGRKTANVVLSVAFNIPAFAVDTHVERVSKRLNIALEFDNVTIVEQKLMQFFPKDKWNKLHHQMIFFGRYHCLARKPHCDICSLKNKCNYYNNRGVNDEKL
ncbi:MAG: endonuclease [Haloplasmataceae bacterium]|jgi:endonuclease-3|nr:endonuclease [Haloplasmataceae bacterium]